MTIAHPIKYPGGKAYLASKIVERMPAHLHYVEPFAGGLSVLLAKHPNGISEVVNDLNGFLTNFWAVLQCRELFPQFLRIVQAMPFSEREWQEAGYFLNEDAGKLDAAVDFFVNCRMSMGGMGKTFAPLSKSRTRRGMSEQASAWLTAIEGLPEVHARLQRVVVLNRDALDVLKQQDSVNTLFYADSPYHPSTRSSVDLYAYEMTHEDHCKYLNVVNGCKGKVMVSGYRSDLYDKELSHWRREDFELPNNAAKSATKRRMIESLWMNY